MNDNIIISLNRFISSVLKLLPQINYSQTMNFTSSTITIVQQVSVFILNIVESITNQ